ncbi:hypothetical protein COOONC_19996 [Cooperia oncophora]
MMNFEKLLLISPLLVRPSYFLVCLMFLDAALLVTGNKTTEQWTLPRSFSRKKEGRQTFQVLGGSNVTLVRILRQV